MEKAFPVISKSKFQQWCYPAPSWSVPNASECHQLLWLGVLLGHHRGSAGNGGGEDRGRHWEEGSPCKLLLFFFNWENTYNQEVFHSLPSPTLYLPPIDRKTNLKGLPHPPSHLKWQAVFCEGFSFLTLCLLCMLIWLYLQRNVGGSQDVDKGCVAPSELPDQGDRGPASFSLLLHRVVEKAIQV